MCFRVASAIDLRSVKCRSFPAVRLNLHLAIGFQYSYKSVLLSLPIYTPPWQVAVNRIVPFRELVVSITGLRDNGLVYDRPARKLDDKHPIKPEYRIPDYCQQYPDTSFLSRVKAERRDSNLRMTFLRLRLGRYAFPLGYVPKLPGITRPGAG